MLVLTIYFNKVLNTIQKSLRFTNLLLKKSLKFVIYDKKIYLVFYFLLALYLLEQSCFFEKVGSKQYFFLAWGSNNTKIVFILLKTVITL